MCLCALLVAVRSAARNLTELLLPFRFAQPIWLLGLYYPLLAFVLIALFCVSCRDPGLMERVVDEEAGEGGWFWNEQVGSFRPPGALYCRECGVLIQDYDHLYVNAIVFPVELRPKSHLLHAFYLLQMSLDWNRNRQEQHSRLSDIRHQCEHPLLLHGRHHHCGASEWYWVIEPLSGHRLCNII